MVETVYETLAAIGYTHPLHPTLTHMPIGLIFAAFVFAVVAKVFNKPLLLSTVRHCVILSLIMLPFTALLGVMDWQYFYANAWLFPIKAKVALAVLLLVVLIISLITVFRLDTFSGRSLVIFGVCLLFTFGLGFFGGELVYRSSQAKTTTATLSSMAKEGASVFEKNCAMCHYSDKTETKIGPGLKGLYTKEKMTVSSWEVTDENVRRQLKTPFDSMPSFPDQTEAETEAIIAYLRNL